MTYHDQEEKPQYAEIDCCIAPGCQRKVAWEAGDYCGAHYYRIRVHGSLDLPKREFKGERRQDTFNGYIRIYVPGHWLSRFNGKNFQLEHRVVFFEHHGEGPFNCHWCSCAVAWQDMHVDHVNEDRQDNDPDNLVASCCTCNLHRNRDKQLIASYASCSRLITFEGVTLNVTEWAARIGVSQPALSYRLTQGWSISKALTTPKKPGNY